MNPVIYDVSVSLDGFIAGPNGDISRFAQEGTVVDDYLERLQDYRCAIMGRSTYEFGYRFGLAPGENPYAGMDTFVFSATIDLPSDSAVTVVRDDPRRQIEAIRARAKGPIYLCGGGAFAGSLLNLGEINMLRLKRAPALLGAGVSLFSGLESAPLLNHVRTTSYENGYLFQEFNVEGR